MRTAPRKPRIDPHSPEGLDIGLPDDDIPGGIPHIGNAETHETKVKVPASRYAPSMNEHGVTGDDMDKPYDQPEAGKTLKPGFQRPHEREYHPLPMFLVEHPHKTPQYRESFCDLITVQTGEPTPIASRDYGRVDIQLLNEDSANDVRIADNEATLLEGRGSVLKHGATGYTRLRTQGRLYAVASVAACELSVIITTEVNR